jgi:hypothetical protein
MYRIAETAQQQQLLHHTMQIQSTMQLQKPPASWTHLCALMAAMVSMLPCCWTLLLASPPGVASPTPPSSVADRLLRAGPLPGTHAPDPACDSSGSEGAVLLLMDTKDASDLRKQNQTVAP